MSSDRDTMRDEIAQEKFGKPFAECAPEERIAVGGTIGGITRKQQMESEGRSEEGKIQGYSDMGHMGGQKGGYSTGYAHDPAKQAEHDASSYYGTDEQGAYEVEEKKAQRT